MDKKSKTVLFLCKCGTNIADNVDLDEITKWAQSKQDSEIVETHNLLCSPDGKKFFKEIITKNKPDSVVVAACSPKMHEKTFQDLLEECGMNLSQLQMANIREHCAWVTKEKQEATKKAKMLINAAVKRSWLSETLERPEMEVKSDILIIGGGIAGIEAALTASAAGRKVYLVEKQISIGGQIIKTEEIAPNMECSPCLVTARMSLVRDDPNIEVIANAEVTQGLGFYGNFVVTITQKANYVESNCIGCEACFEVCPVSVPNEFHEGLSQRKAIYTLFPGSVPAVAKIDEKSCKHFIDGSCNACVEACPFTSINFEQQDTKHEIQIGAIIIATGIGSPSKDLLTKYGYGTIDNIYTINEFELISSSSGPFLGNIQLKNGEIPNSVAVIHCAGSLDKDALPYCSNICCMSASKVGELLRKKNPDAKITNIHNDLIFKGPREQAFYKKQTAAGTTYLKCNDLKSIKCVKNNGQITVKAKGLDDLKVDMVVLATGLTPSPDTAKIAKILNIDLDKSGFFRPAHELLQETTSNLDGIYIAGCAANPCQIPTAITQGIAAVGDAMSKLIPGRKIELEVMTSIIDADVCGGCKLCITVCPYKAISFDSEKGISTVNEAICRGCGTCTATCPSGASKAKHFTDKQIYAEIGGLINE